MKVSKGQSQQEPPQVDRRGGADDASQSGVSVAAGAAAGKKTASQKASLLDHVLCVSSFVFLVLFIFSGCKQQCCFSYHTRGCKEVSKEITQSVKQSKTMTLKTSCYMFEVGLLFFQTKSVGWICAKCSSQISEQPQHFRVMFARWFEAVPQISEPV